MLTVLPYPMVSAISVWFISVVFLLTGDELDTLILPLLDYSASSKSIFAKIATL